MSKVSPIRGAVFSEQAYAQGKMLDHSEWSLPRKITPSDIDMCFDNDGRVLYCEISRHHSKWPELHIGQIKLYQAAVKSTQNLSVLCKHSVPANRQINTRSDIERFSVMVDCGHFQVTPVFESGRWRAFVDGWFKDPEAVFRYVVSESAPISNAKPSGEVDWNDCPF